MVFCRTNPNRAAELMDELGNYLRGKFVFTNLDQLIPLEQELDFVNSYLAIEKARFDEKLEFVYELEPNISVNIPPLTLQPIVENAVKHGIYPKEEGGKVEISVWEEEGAVFIRVRDNGVGMTEEKLQEVLNDKYHIGIGIQNVHKRLISYYGYGLSIRSQVKEGTEVTIRIPREKIKDTLEPTE